MITDEDFTQAMREAVEERGRDYVYPKGEPGYFVANEYGDDTCVYQTPEGTPACIIGVALSKLDLLLPAHSDLRSADRVLSNTGVSRKVFWAAFEAQGMQDAGKTWGEALDEYLELL